TIEHVTVISGIFNLGIGDKFESEKANALNPGSIAIMPPGMNMFAYTKEETIVQVHGIGPWGLTYLNPEDDPRKK
ncbi:MAG TPA: cupin domain-containing protein, partial [Nitrospiria bacterium]|nr:cupin domain-containing protein [Nitrospiria bacterium]